MVSNDRFERSANIAAVQHQLKLAMRSERTGLHDLGACLCLDILSHVQL